ncbi:MAG: hypothetical protein RBU29_02620 [bacterium]|jgi:hypothetical protein|nr:hypothetical protein [bacterium]
MARHSFTKDRISTRDRFVSVLKAPSKPAASAPAPWYRTRANYLALFMIALIFAFLLIVKSIDRVQDSLHSSDPPPVLGENGEEDATQGEMEYEEAQRIFSGTASPPMPTN